MFQFTLVDIKKKLCQTCDQKSESVLKNHFTFNRQTERTSIGSSLPPAIVNLFMTLLETKVIESAILKPKL